MRDDRPSLSVAASLTGLGLIFALWPIVIVHAAYAISVIEGHVLLCNPYWDGCTSISRAGRYGWANHLFRGALLPYTALLALYWWLNQRWLLALGDPGSRGMLVIGYIGALFMILYVTFLGSEGPMYQLMRRYGINVYFGATYLAQVLLIGRLRAITAAGVAPWPGWLVPVLLMTALGVFALGLLFLVVSYGLALEKDRLENALEWGVALLMQLTVLVTVWGWRASGAHVRVGCERNSCRS
jgi:hypothetical protein